MRPHARVCVNLALTASLQKVEPPLQKQIRRATGIYFLDPPRGLGTWFHARPGKALSLHASRSTPHPSHNSKNLDLSYA